jgi:hypothetical protein
MQFQSLLIEPKLDPYEMSLRNVPPYKCNI